MKKFFDWMHGVGRNTVIALIFIVGCTIVANYVITERGGKLSSPAFHPRMTTIVVTAAPQDTSGVVKITSGAGLEDGSKLSGK
jgi:hypothetical protein